MENQIEYKGSRVCYTVQGNGFPLIFLHGFCEDHSVWVEFVRPFIENYRVILPDLPGFGKSGLPAEITLINMDFYADCIREILDAEKITSCALVGHSMGGYVTLNFASRYPEYLKAFGLFHSSGYEDDEAKKQDRTRVADFVRKNGAASFVNELYPKLFGEIYKSSHPDKIDALKKLGTEVSSTEGIAAAALAMRDRKETTDALRKSSVPVLFIIGKEDKVVPAEKTLQQTHLPSQASICLLDGVAHMGMFETTEQSRTAIREWLTLFS